MKLVLILSAILAIAVFSNAVQSAYQQAANKCYQQYADAGAAKDPTYPPYQKCLMAAYQANPQAPSAPAKQASPQPVSQFDQAKCDALTKPIGDQESPLVNQNFVDSTACLPLETQGCPGIGQPGSLECIKANYPKMVDCVCTTAQKFHSRYNPLQRQLNDVLSKPPCRDADPNTPASQHLTAEQKQKLVDFVTILNQVAKKTTPGSDMDDKMNQILSKFKRLSQINPSKYTDSIISSIQAKYSQFKTAADNSQQGICNKLPLDADSISSDDVENNPDVQAINDQTEKMETLKSYLQDFQDAVKQGLAS